MPKKYVKKRTWRHDITESKAELRKKQPQWAYKHVPTGLYWCRKHLVPKGIFKVWSNLHNIPRTWPAAPHVGAIFEYFNPEDAISHKRHQPKRISKPGEWIIVGVRGTQDDAPIVRKQYSKMSGCKRPRLDKEWRNKKRKKK